jgi:hypothetical protein
LAKNNKQRMQHYNQVGYDKKQKVVEFKARKTAYLNDQTIFKGKRKKKMSLKWIFVTIVSRDSAVNYTINEEKKEKIVKKKVYVDRLKKAVTKKEKKERKKKKKDKKGESRQRVKMEGDEKEEIGEKE